MGVNSIGPFVGWNVALFLTEGKQPGLQRVLKAGGATHIVFARSSRDVAALKGITYAFVEASCAEQEPHVFEALVKAKVMCLKPEFIAGYLLKTPGTLPPLEEYLVQAE